MAKGTFTQGETRKKRFYITDSNGHVVAISNVVAIMYDVKSNAVIQRFDNGGVNPAVEDLGGGYVRITATPDITRKCPEGKEIWIDILVGNMERIFRGRFGTALKSPLSNEL